jgi:DNA-binding MarR family transcriptional regulator
MIDINGLNKDFESRVRLGIMAVLMVNESITFNDLKQTLSLSDGNLASHTNALETKGYISISKIFVGKKTETTYFATDFGKLSFKQHIEALGKLLNT